MQPTVLVIEDNLQMNENIAEILSLAQYEVLTAPNGKLGVELASLRKPDLILCDIMMPELDGFGVLHILRRNPETANIPLVFLTARADREDFRKGMNLGANDYVTKPFNDLDLLKVVEIRIRKSDQVPTGNPAFASAMQEGLLADLQAKLFQRLSADRPIQLYKRKQLLFMQGQHPQALFLLESGELKTYRSNREGKEFITAFHTAGALVGYVPLITYNAYADTAQVLSEQLVVKAVPKQEFLNLLYSHCELSQQFMQLMALQLKEAEGRMLELAYQSVRQKVAGALLKMQAGGGNQPGLTSNNRKDIASLIGTATETLNRTLSDFKEEGLIEITETGIRVLDVLKLQRIQA